MIGEHLYEINQRLAIGHWEADTIIGEDRALDNNPCGAENWLFDHQKKPQARTIEEISQTCIAAITVHQQSFKMIIFNNGTGFHGHKILERQFPVLCYFAHPYHPEKQGTNKTTNGLIHQYNPKGSGMRRISKADCDWIAEKLNP